MKTIRQYTLKSTGKTITVEILIDIESIAQTLASRAVRSKQGKSQMVNGDIVCRLIPDDKPDRS